MNRVLDSLRSFQLAQAGAYRRAAEATKVPETSLIALQVLRAAGDDGIPMKDLAREVGVSPAVLTGVVDRLEERSWARRTPSAADRRLTVVVASVTDDDDVVAVLDALDQPLRRLANSIPESTAAMVREFIGAMTHELRAFEPKSGR